MARLGGGGPQTALGALLWLSNKERVGLASGVGEDFPASCNEWLETAGVDTSGLLWWPHPILRAWQILEEDGKRAEVWMADLVVSEVYGESPWVTNTARKGVVFGPLKRGTVSLLITKWDRVLQPLARRVPIFVCCDGFERNPQSKTTPLLAVEVWAMLRPELNLLPPSYQ